MKYTMTLIAAAYAAITLASFVAVRNISEVLDGLRRQGGGIGDFSSGVTAAAQWPLIAAWIAVLASAVAIVFLRRTTEQSSRGTWLAAIAITAGAASVLTFRSAITFIMTAALPGGIPTPAAAVPDRLLSASAITAVCFVAAILTMVLAFRTRAASRFAIIVLVVSLGVSASLVVTLRSLSSQYHAIATGRVANLDRLR